MKVLVTGGAGFIGSNFVWYLLSLGHEVLVYDAFTYAGRSENLPSNVRFVRGDIADRDGLFSVVRDFQPDAVINFAAETHVDRSIRDPEPFIRTNVYGVFTLLEVVRRFDLRFIHVSTDEVYGDLEGKEPANEDSPLHPSNPYSATKASGDMLIMAYWRTYGINASVVRPSNNYGPRQHPEKLIPKAIIRAVNDLPVIVHGDGSQRRDWLYVEDTCRAIWLVVEKGRPGEIYNIPGFNERSVLEVVEMVLELLNKPKNLIRFVSDRPGQDRRYLMRGDKILSLGWKPMVNWEDGLRMTIRWYLENEWWWRSLISDEYFVKDTPWQ